MLKKYAWRKGSLTVEAAAVMSVVFLVILSCLYLCFYVHNRAWLTAAAYESALAGSMEAVRENGKVQETAELRSQELTNIGFFGAENLSAEVHTGAKVSVFYSLDTIETFGNQEWHLEVEGSSKIVNPVSRIRQIKAAAEMIESIGE